MCNNFKLICSNEYNEKTITLKTSEGVEKIAEVNTYGLLIENNMFTAITKRYNILLSACKNFELDSESVDIIKDIFDITF